MSHSITLWETYQEGVPFTAVLRANSAPPSALAVAAASGPYRGTADLTATLSGCADVANRPITFTLTTTAGQRTIDATTNSAGAATASATALLVAADPIPVGVYEPTAGQGISAAFAGGTGCAAASGTANLTVTKRTPTLTWNAPAAITYGAALSGGELGASASAGNTAVAGTYAYTANTAPVSTGTILPAGNYQLGVTFTPTDTANYHGATDDAPLTVDKAPLMVTTAPATKRYGAALPTFGATYSGFTNGDTPATALTGTVTFATNATSSSTVGPYPVTPGGLTAANYALAFAAGTLTVERAPLTITADDTVRPYGSADPSFTVRYGAFALNEGPSVLGGTLQCASGATTTSAPGPYAITCSGLSAANYALRYDPGTLTIEKAAQSIAFAPPATLSLDDPPYTLSATADSGLAVDFAVAPGAPCSITGAQLTGVAAGDCVVSATQPGDGNYRAATPVARTIQITAAQVPTASPQPPTAPAPAPVPPPAPPTPTSYRLTITTTGNGTALATTPGPLYAAGARVEIVATPATGALLTGWTVDGTFQGWHPRLVVEMTDHRAVAATFAAQTAFPDTPGNAQQAEAIAQLTARGIIKGYGDGTFGPNNPVQRAQVAGMIVRAMGWQNAANTPPPFSDRGGTDDELWRAVGILAARGIARGYGDTTFRPDDPILQIQAIGIITRSMVSAGYWSWQADSPAVAPEIGGADHRQEYATFIHYAGAPPGVAPDGRWGGPAGWDQPATRAWFAQVLWQALASYWGTPR